MRSRLWALAAVGAALIAAAPAVAAPVGKAAASKTTASRAAACGRACLVDLMQRWLDALPRHSTAGLPIATNIRFTEQAASIPVGDGLFVSATEGPTSFKVFAADPTSGQVGFFGMMKQWDKPILLAARLKVVGGKITEAEHVFAADLRPNSMPNLQTPRPGLVEDVPAGHRTPRAQMAKIAWSYFDSIEQDDGNIAPYAEDCVRHENGMQTTTQKTPQATPLDNASAAQQNAFATIGRLGCRDAMNTHVLQYITMIRPRHLLIVDEQKGLVFGFPRFVHRGDVRNLKIVGVPGVDSMPLAFGPNDLQAAEMFKITDGKIHEIEANGFINAYMTPTGWDDLYPETYSYATVHPHTHPRRVGTTSKWVN